MLVFLNWTEDLCSDSKSSCLPADFEKSRVAAEKVSLCFIDPDPASTLDDEPEVCGHGNDPENGCDSYHDGTYEQQPALKVILGPDGLGALGNHRHCTTCL